MYRIGNGLPNGSGAERPIRRTCSWNPAACPFCFFPDNKALCEAGRDGEQYDQ